MKNNDYLNKDTIPHSRPTLGPDEAKAAADVVGSGYIAEGEKVKHFEHDFADYMGAGYALSTNSGTAALHLTLLAMGIGPGDEVIIPSYVCSALLNAVNYTGARAVLGDIDPDTFNLDAADTRRRISPSTRAIIVPHLFGLPADMESLLGLNVPLVEDCAQSIGAVDQQRPVGLSGVAGIFSFYATKVITTAEGGMVATNCGDIAARIRDLKTYDRRRDYRIRYNYKMNDIQAALGIVQLKKLESITRRRQRIAEQYHRAFHALNLKLPPTGSSHIYFRYVLGLKMDAGPWIRELARRGVAGDRPIHRPLHQHLNLSGYPATDKAWQQSLSIPIYPTLTDEEINRIIESVTRCYKKFY